mmetsp:Transcript_14974/g.32072  ORF Transcript_14974/g.32072 Transcript_14974/m.32072 type:complete len:167 (-) Transcript_14974:69-569(-)
MDQFRGALRDQATRRPPTAGSDRRLRRVRGHRMGREQEPHRNRHRNRHRNNDNDNDHDHDKLVHVRKKHGQPQNRVRGKNERSLLHQNGAIGPATLSSRLQLGSIQPYQTGGVHAKVVRKKKKKRTRAVVPIIIRPDLLPPIDCDDEEGGEDDKKTPEPLKDARVD